MKIQFQKSNKHSTQENISTIQSLNLSLIINENNTIHNIF